MKRQKEQETDGRINTKQVHVTLHKLTCGDKNYWLKKGMEFRQNTVACLVGMEENHEEEKGLHAHIVMQFSTKQKLSRKQFVDHFGTDSLHISTKPNKEALLMALGYISKTGNTKQSGVFTHRGVEIDPNPEVYRFQYQVKTVDDGLRYFQKVIEEYINSDEDIIAKMIERKDAIGRWLQRHPTHFKTLQKLEYTWKLNERNVHKKGFQFASFIDSPSELLKSYQAYLKEFPALFEKHLPKDSDLVLEDDFATHQVHDLEVLRRITIHLKIAQKFGHKRPHKSLNLYLWSKNPSFGKTRLLDTLNASMIAYRLPDDQYYVDYENLKYQVLVSDEAESFLKSKDYGHLKLLFEGASVEFNRKNRTKVIKHDNPLIVLAENISFDILMKRNFSKRYDTDVMRTRILDLELKSRATLHFFLDRCVILGL